MALQIDSADLFDLDARTEKVVEHLFVLGPLGKRYLLCREPSIKQLTNLQIVASGRNADPAAAARDFLEATILTLDELDERLDADTPEGEERDPALVEAEKLLDADEDAFVDVDFLLEKLADPLSTFGEKELASISGTIMKRATAFPTKSSSDSSRGRSATGSSSRRGGRRRASTPSS